jgi:hypothetical protein
MIISRLNGGLGNQLFQYATGRRLAHIRNTSLSLDAGIFRTYHLHKYALDKFNIHGKIALESDLKKIKGIYNVSIIEKVSKKIGLFRFRNIVRERSIDFDSSILELPDNVYLDGYWQSEKYFKDIRGLLLKEIVVSNLIEGENKIMADKILGSNSVSVHVRRGDYVNNSLTNKIHGVMPMEYYLSASKIFGKNIKDVHFFIFSDDTNWARENLKFIQPCTFVDYNGPEKNYEDMRLMSMCKHNIIANSSFSWWGAWLNQNPNKIVIAPQKWFANQSIDSRDIVPESWLKV